MDALRGLVMATMIFVNDLAGAPATLVPAWMRHFPGDAKGMTFVDLVFPAFLFTVGLSIPLSLGPRVTRPGAVAGVLVHILQRTVSLLVIGVLMVHETPDSTRLGWPGALWTSALYVSAIVALGKWQGTRPGVNLSLLNRFLRWVGWGMLLFLALSFRDAEGRRILGFSPWTLRTSWYGILGLIGWAYLVASLVFLVFRYQRTALLGSMVLLYCLYPADQGHAFDAFWLSRYVGIGSMLGSQAAISVAGVLLGTTLAGTAGSPGAERTRFTLLLVAGCAAAALLLDPLYGINKNQATPSWCLWASAITAGLWLVFHRAGDLSAAPGGMIRALGKAGNNVLLAYLLSNLWPCLLQLLGGEAAYHRLASGHLAGAVIRSVACSAGILAVSVGLNRAGFRVRL